MSAATARPLAAAQPRSSPFRARSAVLGRADRLRQRPQQQRGSAAPAAARQRRGRRRLAARAGPAPDGDASPEELVLPTPKKPAQLEPSYWLGREGTLEAQLKALQHNNFPNMDAGIEAAYRFAGLDPWERSTYFSGVSLDLGQFERFRRIFYTPFYVTLLNLSEWEVTSSLEVSEAVWVARVHVVNAYRKEARDYAVTMERRLGGKYDGVWYISKLQADGCNSRTLYGII